MYNTTAYARWAYTPIHISCARGTTSVSLGSMEPSSQSLLTEDGMDMFPNVSQISSSIVPDTPPSRKCKRKRQPKSAHDFYKNNSTPDQNTATDNAPTNPYHEAVCSIFCKANQITKGDERTFIQQMHTTHSSNKAKRLELRAMRDYLHEHLNTPEAQLQYVDICTKLAKLDVLLSAPLPESLTIALDAAIEAFQDALCTLTGVPVRLVNLNSTPFNTRRALPVHPTHDI